MSDPKPNGLERTGHRPPEVERMAGRIAELEAQCERYFKSENEALNALIDVVAERDKAQTLLELHRRFHGKVGCSGDECQCRFSKADELVAECYYHVEQREAKQAAEASAAAMRAAIATAQRALDQYVILYDRTALASEAETAMREAVADTAGQHLLDELEGLRELVAGATDFTIDGYLISKGLKEHHRKWGLYRHHPYLNHGYFPSPLAALAALKQQ